MSKSHGLYIGRFQPFHNGHNSVVQQIIRDGLRPVIIVGSANINDERNPLSYFKRMQLIKSLYGKAVSVYPLDDYDDWNEWYNYLADSIDLSKSTIYTHVKQSDLTSFEFDGKQFTNCSYNELFEYKGHQLKYLDPYLDRLGNTVSATHIRADEQYACNHLDARIYNQLKDMQWWK